MGITELNRVTAAAPVELTCDHLCDTSSHYDHEQKLLTFVLVCPVCHIEKVVETLHYEPHFTPNGVPADADAGGTVHALPTRRQPPLGRAA